MTQETKVKGYINIHGYKVLADENVNPGRYGFRIIHDTEKPHYFSFEDKNVVRDWMKALMKATIDRDYSSEYLPTRSSRTMLMNANRTCHLIMQHTHDPSHRRASYEPRSTPTLSRCTRRHAESAPSRKPESIVNTRRGGIDGFAAQRY